MLKPQPNLHISLKVVPSIHGDNIFNLTGVHGVDCLLIDFTAFNAGKLTIDLDKYSAFLL